jgi:CO/xanthine dehydrogenase Mo-binding subunit
MEEQFFMVTRHPCTFKIKSAVTKDGKITGRQCRIWWNGGAYADIGPRVTQKAGFTSAGPYDIDNVWIDSYAVYTNRPPAGALRDKEYTHTRVNLCASSRVKSCQA